MTSSNMGSGPLSDFPTIDERNMEQLIEQIKRLAPAYTPEWRFRPDDPDPGTALSLMFAHLLAGNIERLNQVPSKSFLAFLNRFHVELAQARPALAQVIFELTEGTPESVLVEQGTQLAATVPGEAEPVLFETARTILLTTARLLDVLTVSPKLDRIVRLMDGGVYGALDLEGRGTALFGLEGDNLQEHAMYLQHDYLFLLKHPAFLEIAVFNSKNIHTVDESVQLLADTSKVIWEFYSNGAWSPFDRVYGHASIIRLVKLTKQTFDRYSHQGVDGYWIRCRARSLDEQTGGSELSKVQFDRLLLKSEYAAPRDEDGITPDRLYHNDMQLDMSDGYMPFGDFFAMFGLFYISSEEVLSKRGASVTLHFDAEIRQHVLVPEGPPQINWKMVMKRHEIDKTESYDPVTVSTIQWEYWNGSAWVLLPVNVQSQKVFSTPWEGVVSKEITFVCPVDMEQTLVNAEENYWIRGRIIQVMNAYSPKAIYYSPVIHDMKLRFGYEEPAQPPQQLFIVNNLDVRERTSEVQTGSYAMRPFIPLDGRYPALWLGFDTPPSRGPINLYWLLNDRRLAEEDVPFMEWEYLRKNGASASWSTLAVADETNGFSRSGDLQLVGPQDFALATYYGVERYWIRVVNRDGRYDLEDESAHVPRLRGLFLNATLAVQQETIPDELPVRLQDYDSAEEQVSECYVLARTPVLSEEVWVDETGTLSRDELDLLIQDEEQVDLVRDSEKELLRVWVRYYAVDQFLRSGPHDRHYRIDRASGRITFGDGKHGRKPQLSGDDSVRVTYATGGGKRGNVPADTITTLHDSIAFIDGVSNPFPAAGGCDHGTVEEATIRGPKLFAHRRRGVTAEDFEWLTREAHPNVAKVRCLPNVNAKLERQPGAISIVVLPKSGVGSGAHFQELKRVVEASLMEKAASNIAFPGSLQVIEPALLEIGVQATVWVKSMEDVVPVEREIIRKLNSFLDPINGNADGRGWEIGQVIHHSMFYALLKSVGPVTHIPQLALDVYKLENGERLEWHTERIAEVQHGVFIAGEHRITVEVKR